MLNLFCIGPYPFAGGTSRFVGRRIPQRVRLSPFEPNSIHCPRASHPVISETVARLRRVRQEHAGYYTNELNTLNYATSCRTITQKSLPGLEHSGKPVWGTDMLCEVF